MEMLVSPAVWPKTTPTCTPARLLRDPRARALPSLVPETQSFQLRVSTFLSMLVKVPSGVVVVFVTLTWGHGILFVVFDPHVFGVPSQNRVTHDIPYFRLSGFNFFVRVREGLQVFALPGESHACLAVAVWAFSHFPGISNTCHGSSTQGPLSMASSLSTGSWLPWNRLESVWVGVEG